MTAVYVVARFRAKEGQERNLTQVLARLVAPTQREPGCVQYDLVQGADDPRDICIIEHWVDEASLEQHISAEALRRTVGEAMALTDGPPQGPRYRLV